MAGIGQLLVGREAELQALAELLDGLEPDAGGMTLQLAGEPGIGKSSLLGELAARARARGHTVLSGRAAEFEAELPFGVFCDAMDDWLVGLDRPRLEALAGGLARELAVVFPAFEPLAPDRGPELREERYRAYRAVRALLAATAADAPLVVVLDDVQWADPGSVELMSHLLAHPPRGRVLVALGFRPAQIAPQLSTALAAALRARAARRLDLVPLSAEAAHQLLGEELSGPARDELCRESGGNPFFLLQLARGSGRIERGRALGAGLTTSVPEGVQAALESELSALSEPALLLLRGGAVAGDPFEVVVAAGAADLGEAEALDVIDELLEFQLVNPTSLPGRLAFRHPIVRASVYESASSGWRARAHARVASLLATRGASPSAQAPHLERSAREGDSAAVAVLSAAGAASAPRTPALSARWYAAALRLLPSGSEVEAQRIGLLIAMATALGGSGQLQESRSALTEVLERLPAGHPARVRIVAYCAAVEHLLGRHPEARLRLTEAHRLLADHASPEAVALKIELAAGCSYESRNEEMLSWAAEALTAATELGHRQFELVAAAQVAYARYSLGLPAGEDLDRAVAVLDAIDDTELAGRLDAVLWVGWAEAQLERFERGIAHCQRAIDVSRATGQGAYLLGTMSAQAWALIRVGRLAEADEILAAAIEAFRLAPNAFLPQAVGLTSILGSYKGDLAGAVRAAEECVRLTADDPGQLRARSGLQLGTALIEMGEAERAREAVLEAMGGPELPLLGRAGRCTSYEILTRAEIALGRVEAAEGWAAKAEEAMYGGGLAVDAAAGHRALAAVALARGEAPRAARIALDAGDRAEAAGGPVEAGRCRILAARALAAAGEPDRAIAALERAAGDLARIGADGYRAEAEEALRRLGRPVARRADSAGRGLRSLSASGTRTTAVRAAGAERAEPAGIRELAPGDVFAGYRIEALAGRGGMGLVYRARQVRPERAVAVKVIMPELAGDRDFRARFELEASLAAQIEHPNVIPIYEVGDVEGMLYIVMRFVESTDLRVLLRSHQRLGAVHAARLVSQIAAALDAAHARGMVHRDVKPANVLVTGAHPDEHLYLTDFGLTKRSADIGGITVTGAYVGTLDYIAPEQVNGDPVDGRADVYALGCVLYELLTGAVPFPREHEVAKIFAHVSSPPPVPSAAVPGVPAELDAVVARAMAKDPADRFPAAGELARAAIAAAGSRGSSAGPRGGGPPGRPSVPPAGGDAASEGTVRRGASRKKRRARPGATEAETP